MLHYVRPPFILFIFITSGLCLKVLAHNPTIYPSLNFTPQVDHHTPDTSRNALNSMYTNLNVTKGPIKSEYIFQGC